MLPDFFYFLREVNGAAPLWFLAGSETGRSVAAQ
jgi:hypothetical protein